MPASRLLAYYAMFYLAEALLLGKGMAFSKHSAVHAAFGREFAKTGEIPAHLHRYLIDGMEVRHVGDYGSGDVPAAEAALQIDRAEEFLRVAGTLLES